MNSLPTCIYPLLVSDPPLLNVLPPAPPLPTSNCAPELTVVVPPTVSVFPDPILSVLLLVIERLAALALARSSVTVAFDVFPMVTALELFGTPAVQFVARLQLPEPVFQLSAAGGG